MVEYIQKAVRKILKRILLEITCLKAIHLNNLNITVFYYLADLLHKVLLSRSTLVPNDDLHDTSTPCLKRACRTELNQVTAGMPLMHMLKTGLHSHFKIH